MTQEEKINVAELLKNCPKNMELNCLMYEDVYFDYVDECNIIHCYIQHETHKTSLTFNQHGTPNSDIKSKCVIFPKGKTTWEGFEPPCKFKDGDIVTWKDGGGSLVACIYKERKNTTSFYHHIALYNRGIGIILDGEIVLTDDELCFATEEEKQILFDSIKANGYRWNKETKSLEELINKNKFVIGAIVTNGKIKGKISLRDGDSYVLEDGTHVFFNEVHNWELVPNKFDVTTLKPFKSEVLVRDNVDEVWLPCFFGGICNNDNKYPYRTVGGERWNCCIPYEGNEHLLDTTNDCIEYYKTW